MEKTYWLGRRSASLAMARKAANSEARLIHLDLAGRYSVQAAAADGTASPRADTLYYTRLEEGARYLANEADSSEERDVHLGMANRYGRLGLDAAPGKGV